MFEEITKDNWLLFAQQNYSNPTLETNVEFLEDIKRFKYLKRLLKKYDETGNLKERLILNHIIVLQNVFGVEASGVLLFYKIDQDYWPALKTFMMFLNMVPEGELADIQLDPYVWKTLENI